MEEGVRSKGTSWTTQNDAFPQKREPSHNEVRITAPPSLPAWPLPATATWQWSRPPCLGRLMGSPLPRWSLAELFEREIRTGKSELWCFVGVHSSESRLMSSCGRICSCFRQRAACMYICLTHTEFGSTVSKMQDISAEEQGIGSCIPDSLKFSMSLQNFDFEESTSSRTQISMITGPANLVSFPQAYLHLPSNITEGVNQNRCAGLEIEAL